MEIQDYCNDAGLVVILYTVRNILRLIRIVGPILCMISLGYTFIMLVSDPENKKLISRIKNSAIALVVLFMIPITIDVTMQLLGNKTQFSSCWNEAAKPKTGTPTYKKVDDIESDSSKKTDDSKKDSSVTNRSGSGVW